MRLLSHGAPLNRAAHWGAQRRVAGAVAAIALVTIACLAPAARASVSWVVEGHGFGHGVGMSQYGAYGYAQHGADYNFILTHYYSGTQVAQLPEPRVVRVLLDLSSGDVEFTGATSACGRTLSPTGTYRAHRLAHGVQLRNSAGRSLANCGTKLRATGHGRIQIVGIGTYRGALEVVPSESDTGSLEVVNALPVDQYVKGVIPNEMPSSWPLEALRAQAVAARSYALSVQVGGNDFDVYDNTSSQVYKGLESETPHSNLAATSTNGQVLMYQGKIAQTYFSACSGGHTESVQNVFFGPPVPYLVGVPDPYDYYCPLHSWTLRFSESQISAKLRSHLDGRLERVVITKRGVSPRIVWARLYGSTGVTTIRGDQLEGALGTYDRWLTFRRVVNGQVVSGGQTEEAAPEQPPGGAAAG
jgi:stage II sporulation protein D